jgi:hypothetical protein
MLLGCVAGGAIAGALGLLVLASQGIGFRNAENMVNFMEKWRLVAGAAGAILGLAIFLISGNRTAK